MLRLMARLTDAAYDWSGLYACEWERAESQYRGDLTQSEAFVFALASQVISECKDTPNFCSQRKFLGDHDFKTIGYLKAICAI